VNKAIAVIVYCADFAAVLDQDLQCWKMATRCGEERGRATLPVPKNWRSTVGKEQMKTRKTAVVRRNAQKGRGMLEEIALLWDRRAWAGLVWVWYSLKVVSKCRFVVFAHDAIGVKIAFHFRTLRTRFPGLLKFQAKYLIIKCSVGKVFVVYLMKIKLDIKIFYVLDNQNF
jgi:hypothetical protein